MTTNTHLPISEALRSIRRRKKLTQAAAGRLPGAPDFRVISHWETGRTVPSLHLLINYLASLGLDFHDFQDALDQASGSVLSETIARQFGAIEERLVAMENAIATINASMDMTAANR